MFIHSVNKENKVNIFSQPGLFASPTPWVFHILVGLLGFNLVDWVLLGLLVHWVLLGFSLVNINRARAIRAATAPGATTDTGWK